MPFDANKFYLGANIGWINGAYRHDLGRAFMKYSPSTPPPDHRYPPSDPRHDQEFYKIIKAYFTHLSFRNIKVVRMWLLEGLEGMSFVGASYKRVSKLDKFSLDNYSTYVEPRIKIIMNEAQRYHIQVYWCLLDAAWLTNEDDMKNNPWYRLLLKHLVENAGASFKYDILLPFLGTIKPFKTNVFAIDIANEVDWIWRKKIMGMGRSTVVSFVHDVYNFIAGYLPSPDRYYCTASFASHNELMKPVTSQQEKVDFLDFYDCHRYFDPAAPANSDHGHLPKWLSSKACVIGEAGHKYYGNVTKMVDETKQATSSKTLMDEALAKDYTGVLLWRYAPVGDGHRLLKLTKGDTGNVSYPDTVLSSFLTGFKAAAAKAAAAMVTPGTPIPSGQDPFTDYERPIWRQIQPFVSTIPLSRRP